MVWDLQQTIKNCDEGVPSAGGCLIHRLKQHIGKVQAVDFSCDAKYLLTLGGQDDNDLVVWDVEGGYGICGSPAAKDSALCAKVRAERRSDKRRRWEDDISPRTKSEVSSH